MRSYYDWKNRVLMFELRMANFRDDLDVCGFHDVLSFGYEFTIMGGSWRRTFNVG